MSRYFYAQYERQAKQAARDGWRPPPSRREYTEGEEANGADGVDGADAYAVLWLRRGAPPDVVRAAYRALAARLHPDAGGDGDAMRRLNAAYERLRGEGVRA